MTNQFFHHYHPFLWTFTASNWNDIILSANQNNKLNCTYRQSLNIPFFSENNIVCACFLNKFHSCKHFIFIQSPNVQLMNLMVFPATIRFSLQQNGFPFNNMVFLSTIRFSLQQYGFPSATVWFSLQLYAPLP